MAEKPEEIAFCSVSYNFRSWRPDLTRCCMTKTLHWRGFCATMILQFRKRGGKAGIYTIKQNKNFVQYGVGSFGIYKEYAAFRASGGGFGT